MLHDTGIPPSASHVATLIDLIRREQIPALWVADYFDEQTPRLIAERTGAKFLYVPLYTDPDKPARFVSAEPNWVDCSFVDRGSGFEQLEDAPEYGR